MVSMHNEVFEWWETTHLENDGLYLTGHSLNDYLNYFKATTEFNDSENVLEIGIGTGRAVHQMHSAGKNVCCVDVSHKILNKVSSIAKVYTVEDMNKIPASTIDLAFHVTVAQHVDNFMLRHHIENILNSLRDAGTCFMQFAENIYPHDLDTEVQAQKGGGWCRNLDEVTKMVIESGGKVSDSYALQSGNDWTWHAIKIHKGI